jgi:hypothetical protein
MAVLPLAALLNKEVRMKRFIIVLVVLLLLVTPKLLESDK